MPGKILMMSQSITLDEFKIDNYQFQLSALSGLEKPFKNVVHLFLCGRFKGAKNSVLTFAQLFPKLEQLSLNFIESEVPILSDSHYILQHLPNLEQFFI